MKALLLSMGFSPDRPPSAPKLSSLTLSLKVSQMGKLILPQTELSLETRTRITFRFALPKLAIRATNVGNRG